MKLLELLKPHVDKLHGLLAAPEPGLFTWNMFVGREWKAIAELWDSPESETVDGDTKRTTESH